MQELYYYATQQSYLKVLACDEHLPDFTLSTTNQDLSYAGPSSSEGTILADAQSSSSQYVEQPPARQPSLAVFDLDEVTVEPIQAETPNVSPFLQAAPLQEKFDSPNPNLLGSDEGQSRLIPSISEGGKWKEKRERIAELNLVPAQLRTVEQKEELHRLRQDINSYTYRIRQKQEEEKLRSELGLKKMMMPTVHRATEPPKAVISNAKGNLKLVSDGERLTELKSIPAPLRTVEQQNELRLMSNRLYSRTHRCKKRQEKTQLAIELAILKETEAAVAMAAKHTEQSANNSSMEARFLGFFKPLIEPQLLQQQCIANASVTQNSEPGNLLDFLLTTPNNFQVTDENSHADAFSSSPAKSL